MEGQWFDSRGQRLPLKGESATRRLAIDWGSAETERGRTVYRILHRDTIEVVDSVQSAGAWSEFGRARYVRAGAAVATGTAWSEHLRFLTSDGSWWWTSNEPYAAQDGVDAYALRHVIVPGDVAVHGCLWGLRDGSTTAVFWHFFQAWDRAAGAPFFYQSGGDGATGMGTGWRIEGTAVSFEQAFQFADGSTQRQLHRSIRMDRDAMVTETFEWQDGRWQPQRSYKWERRPSAPTPCPAS